MLTICLATVTNDGNLNQRTSVVNGVNDAPVTDANSPQIFRTLKLSAARGARVSRQSFDAFENSPRNGVIKRLQFFARRARKNHRVLTHGVGAWANAVTGVLPAPVTREARGDERSPDTPQSAPCLFRSMSTARLWPRSFTRNSTPGMSTECLVSIGTEYTPRPPAWPLTVKLRGRTEAPDWTRGCTLSFCTRGDTTDSHGPLQRLLGCIVTYAESRRQTSLRAPSLQTSNIRSVCRPNLRGNIAVSEASRHPLERRCPTLPRRKGEAR